MTQQHDSLTQSLAHTIHSVSPSDNLLPLADAGLRDFFAAAFPVVLGKVPDKGFQIVSQMYPDAHGAGAQALRAGYAGHSLDYDDYHPGLRGHPSTVILPALLAVWDADSMSIDALRRAYIIGVEIAGRMGLALGTQHYMAGFHATATLGAVASAGATAYLLELDSSQTAIALGLAATQASGLRAQFGSDVKPLHAGMAARTGVESALLAVAGFNGQEDILPAFLNCFGFGAENEQSLLQNWGNPWRIEVPGLEFKRYPTCGGTHGSADAALMLRHQLLEHGIAEDEIASSVEDILIRFPLGADTAPYVRHPKSGIEARFSLEYVVAVVLLKGELTLDDVAAGEVTPDIHDFTFKIRREVDPSAPPDAENPQGRFHHLILRLTSGDSFSARVSRGDLDIKAAKLDTQEKFRQTLAPILSSQQLGLMIDHLALRSNNDLVVLRNVLFSKTDIF